jgi:CDP-4-dehydro-6-deoxyglucose reductase, E3
MSGWLFEKARPGDSLRIRGPFGECYYQAGDLEVGLLLAGTGTGLAPLAGVVREALRQGHRGRVNLYHGGGGAEDFYLDAELRGLERAHPNLVYHRVMMPGAGEAGPGVRCGRLEEMVLADHPRPAGLRSYICGNPSMVKGLQRRLFMAGQSLRTIFSDPFVPSGGGAVVGQQV